MLSHPSVHDFFNQEKRHVQNLIHKWDASIQATKLVDVYNDMVLVLFDIFGTLMFNTEFNQINKKYQQGDEKEKNDALTECLYNISYPGSQPPKEDMPPAKTMKLMMMTTRVPGFVLNLMMAVMAPKGMKELFDKTNKAIFGMLALQANEAPKAQVEVLDKLRAVVSEGEKLTDLEIRDHIMTFIFAGQEPTAHTTSWIIAHLCEHRDIQARVHAEIDSVLKDRSFPEYEELRTSFPYLTAVLHESLRLTPTVPSLSRVATTDTNVAGFFIPQGTVFLVQPYVMHHNEQVWGTDHDQFNPERFFNKPVPAGWMPFGVGPRNCAGADLVVEIVKLLAVTLLRRYEFEFSPEHPLKPRTIGMIKPMHLQTLARQRKH